MPGARSRVGPLGVAPKSLAQIVAERQEEARLLRQADPDYGRALFKGKRHRWKLDRVAVTCRTCGKGFETAARTNLATTCPKCTKRRQWDPKFRAKTETPNG